MGNLSLMLMLVMAIPVATPSLPLSVPVFHKRCASKFLLILPERLRRLSARLLLMLPPLRNARRLSPPTVNRPPRRLPTTPPLLDTIPELDLPPWLIPRPMLLVLSVAMALVLVLAVMAPVSVVSPDLVDMADTDHTIHTIILYLP